VQSASQTVIDRWIERSIPIAVEDRVALAGGAGEVEVTVAVPVGGPHWDAVRDVVGHRRQEAELARLGRCGVQQEEQKRPQQRAGNMLCE
jgi:hypothetical protein